MVQKYFKGLFTDQPGGLFAPPTRPGFTGFLSDPRVVGGLTLAGGGTAIDALSAASQAQDLFAPKDRDIRVINNQAVDLTDPENPKVLGDYGTSDMNQPTSYQEYLLTDNTPTSDEYSAFLNKGADAPTSYEEYELTVPAGQLPTPEGYTRFLQEKATAGATRIDLGGKKEIEFVKSQIAQVDEDLKKTGNWLAESRAISKMGEGIENFQTGALGNVRATVGSIISLLNPEYAQDPKKLSGLFNPSGAELTTSGAAVYQRELARGLQNLNIEEVKINKRITLDLVKQPYVNKVILETLKIDNDAKRLLDEAGNNFLAQNIDYKEYLSQKNTIKDNATKQANAVFDTLENLATKAIPKIIQENVGETIQGFNVNNQVVTIKVQATDKFTGQQDMQGRPIMQTLNGELYVITEQLD